MYLGHVVDNGTVRPTDKIQAVVNFPESKTLKQLHSFMGLVSYFRKYIKNFAALATPLTNLLKKNQIFQFNEDEREAFNTLKHRLCSKLIIQIYPQNCIQMHHCMPEWACS